LKLRTALLAYLALAVLAAFTLDGVWRAAVWVFLGGLAVKSWIAVEKQRRGQ